MMTSIFESITVMRQKFGWDQSDTRAFLTACVVEEAHELQESLSEGEASFQSELADVLILALTICMDQGYDLETLIQTKISEVMQREY